MPYDYQETPQVLLSFLTYHETIRGHSQKTIDEYYLDLRLFFRYLKQNRGLVDRDMPFDDIPIADVGIDLIRTVTLSDAYGFLHYLSRDRIRNPRSRSIEYGLSPASRARKAATLRSFFKYLTNKEHLLQENPIKDLDVPKIRQSLPKYLSLEESLRLLEAVKGPYAERDYCILTLFLNCGLRISELTGLNVTDVRTDHLRVTGKGNKERVVYLNDACMEAIEDYLVVRRPGLGAAEKALFVSRNRNRMSRSTVHQMVKKNLLAAGLDSTQYSSHKLRHTAATLLLQNGVDVRTLQEVLGHDHLNTTQIYTHVDSSELRVAAQASPLSSVRQKRTQPPAGKHKDNPNGD